MFAETHAHLFSEDYKNDLNEVLERAKLSNVEYIIVPATDIETSYKALELTSISENIFCTIGVHPHDSKKWNDNTRAEIEMLLKNKKAVAVGEIGLDYYYDFSPKETQIEVFKEQLNIALYFDLPVVIHNRDADDDMMKIIREYKKLGLRGQFHCFNGKLEDALELVEAGFYISFTGNITFKNADSLREIVKKVPLENILLETDSPYMTPVPFRGKRNEPSNVKLIAEKIAELKNINVEMVEEVTTQNAIKLFNLKKINQPVFTYKLFNSLYINVTNRCNAHCYFCDRKNEAQLKIYSLKMNKSEEPNAEVYINEIGDPTKYEDIVFCGYGEPTIRWNVVKEIAQYVKNNGGKTRMNTNGHGNVINKKDIIPEMKGLIDIISISLNTFDRFQYAEIMGVKPEMYEELLKFIRESKNYVDEVVVSVVDLKEIDIEKAKDFIENDLGVKFRLRPHF